MRTATALFWLCVIVLFAVFGWSFLKLVVGAVLAFLVVLLLCALLLVWTLRRRMRRKLRELRLAVAQAHAHAESVQRRQDAIDTDFEPRNESGPRK